MGTITKLHYTKNNISVYSIALKVTQLGQEREREREREGEGEGEREGERERGRERGRGRERERGMYIHMHVMHFTYILPKPISYLEALQERA